METNAPDWWDYNMLPGFRWRIASDRGWWVFLADGFDEPVAQRHEDSRGRTVIRYKTPEAAYAVARRLNGD